MKVEETKLNTDSILSISTIASAIADASVSADPAQLASMILELSNKNRKKNKPQAMSGEPTHVKSQKSHVINSMAKNLEIPEATKSEIPKSELKLLSKSVSSVLSESSTNPQSMLNSFSMESISNGTSKQKNKHIMHSEEKFQKGNVEMANSLRPVEGEIRCNSQNARNETCALETQNPSFSKHNSSKLTDPNLVVNKSYCDRAPVSSVGKDHEMPAMNGTTIRTAKQIKAHYSSDNESSLDKIQCKTGTQGGAGMTQLREGQSSERISASVSRSDQNITQVFATSQSSAVQDAMRTDSSLSCPSMQNVGPVEQRFRGSKIYENDRAIIKTATPHLGRDVQETPDLHGKAKKDNIVQSNCTPATPKDYKSGELSIHQVFKMIMSTSGFFCDGIYQYDILTPLM